MSLLVPEQFGRFGGESAGARQQPREAVRADALEEVALDVLAGRRVEHGVVVGEGRQGRRRGERRRGRGEAGAQQEAVAARLPLPQEVVVAAAPLFGEVGLRRSYLGFRFSRLSLRFLDRVNRYACGPVFGYFSFLRLLYFL